MPKKQAKLVYFYVSPPVGFGRKAQVDSGLTWSSVFVCVGVGLFGGLVGYLLLMATPLWGSRHSLCLG